SCWGEDYGVERRPSLRSCELPGHLLLESCTEEDRSAYFKRSIVQRPSMASRGTAELRASGLFASVLILRDRLSGIAERRVVHGALGRHRRALGADDAVEVRIRRACPASVQAARGAF